MMPLHFWDFFKENNNASSKNHRKLQDGLFQIASQTCNLLVQVNNTNNISYGHGSTNIHLNNISSSTPSSSSSSNDRNGGTPQPHATKTTTTTTTVDIGEDIENISSDREQLLVLIPPGPLVKTPSKYIKPGILGKPRLSTVREGLPTPHQEDDHYFWSQHGYTQNEGPDGSPSRRWGEKSKWCRPSCIPISLICILIFLVVLLPLLDHATERALDTINSKPAKTPCDSCKLGLIESIPQGLNYTNGSVSNPSTYDTWLDLINSAEESIEIASFYWTLRQSEIYPDPSSIKGENIFQAILKAGIDRRVRVRIAQNAPTRDNPNIDTELLVRRKAAQVRSLNFAKLLGSGVLHTKFILVDRRDFYLGSANMDWRALTQVKELGISVSNCTCLAEDLGKIFDVYWKLGKVGAKIPDTWPKNLSTNFNQETPLNLTLANNETFQTFLSSSPLPFNPKGRTNDIDALLNVIKHAEKFVYIAVMDYFPITIYTPKKKFWPLIDDALKAAAIEHNIKIKMLISWWNHSRPAEDYFLKSLSSISQAYPRVSLEIRRFIVPSTKEQQKIPFARVNHNKYMVTDNTAYISTSNWAGDYFIDTAGVSFVLHDPVFDRNSSHQTLRSDLQSVFERDWNSNYSLAFL